MENKGISLDWVELLELYPNAICRIFLWTGGCYLHNNFHLSDLMQSPIPNNPELILYFAEENDIYWELFNNDDETISYTVQSSQEIFIMHGLEAKKPALKRIIEKCLYLIEQQCIPNKKGGVL